MAQPRLFDLLYGFEVKPGSFFNQHFLISVAACQLIAEPALQEEHDDDPIHSHKAKGGTLQEKQYDGYSEGKGDIQDHPNMFEHLAYQLQIHALKVVYFTLGQFRPAFTIDP